MQSDTSPKSNPGLVLGVILIVAGVLALLAQITGGIVFTPILMFVLGGAFFAGMLLGGRRLGALAVPGGIFTALGIAALAQTYLPAVQSWMYTIPLIIIGISAGLVIYGRWSDKPEVVRGGWKTLRTGLGIFLGIGIAIEILLTLLGAPSGTLFWPAALILSGLFTLIYRSYLVLTNREEEHENSRNLGEPVVWIGIGFLWIQILQGDLLVSDLFVLFNLWPVLLIFAGLGIMFGRRQPLVNLVLGILFVAGMFYVVNNSDQIASVSRGPWAFIQINTGTEGPIDEYISGSGTVASETCSLPESSFNTILGEGCGVLLIYLPTGLPNPNRRRSG